MAMVDTVWNFFETKHKTEMAAYRFRGICFSIQSRFGRASNRRVKFVLVSITHLYFAVDIWLVQNFCGCGRFINTTRLSTLSSVTPDVVTSSSSAMKQQQNIQVNTMLPASKNWKLNIEKKTMGSINYSCKFMLKCSIMSAFCPDNNNIWLETTKENTELEKTTNKKQLPARWIICFLKLLQCDSSCIVTGLMSSLEC